MFCISCGKELKDTARFCPFCGNKIEAPDAKEPPAEAKKEETAVKETPVQIEEEPAAKAQEIKITPPPAVPTEEKPSAEAFEEPAPVELPKAETAVKEEKPSAEKGVTDNKAAVPKKKGKAAVIAAAAVAVAGAALAVPFYIMPSMEYAKAETAMAEGRYEEAHEIFSGLDFKDSQTERVYDASYAIAVDKMNTGDYIGAKEIFFGMLDHNDSNELYKQCNFKLAEADLTAGAYEKAANAFKAMGDYTGAKEKYSESLFAYGDSLAENGDYLKALEVTAEADPANYSDKLVLYRIGAAETYYAEGKYTRASEMLEPVADAEIDGAPVSEFLNKYAYYQLVEKIEKGTADANDARTLAEKPYMDSQLKLMQLCYDLGTKAMESKDYAKAAVMFRNAGSYNNAAQQLKEAQYQLAGDYFKKGDIANARNLYSVVGAYKDSVKQRNDVSALGDGRHNSWNADCCAYLGNFASDTFKVGDTITIKGTAGRDAASSDEVAYLISITSSAPSSAPVICSALKSGSSFETTVTATEEMKGKCEVSIILAATGHTLSKFTFEIK